MNITNRIHKILNTVPTNVLTWGDPFNKNGKDVVVCITGNPGISEFYIDFASELHKNLGLPICVIGHAGHEDISNTQSNLLENNEHLYNLQAQIKHKLDLLENHICSNSKIHLIGHSIGAWIIIELLQKNDKLMERVSSINLLFPTLQRMAESKNGRFLNNFLRKIHWVILFLCKLLYIIPTCAFRLIIYIYLIVNSLPYNYCDAVLKILHPFVIENILLMAFEEMDIVKVLNSEGIHKIKHLTNVIYGNRDDWAPLEYIEDLKHYEPYIQLTEAHNIDHAFVLKSSEHVADMVANFIKLRGKG